MPKPREITTEQYEALGEAQREFYVSGKDGYILDAEGYEDVSGLKRNTESLLKEKKKLQGELKALQEKIGDLDPEQAREALTRIKEFEEKDLMDKGKIDELLDKRFLSERKGYQAKLDALAAERIAFEQQIQQLTTQLASTSRTGQLGKALIEAQVDPRWFEFIEMKAEKTWHWQDGQLVPLDGGDPLYLEGKVPDMKQWITNVLAKARPEILLPSNGGGAQGSGAGRRAGTFSISKADARDNRKFQAIIEQAQKAGVPANQIQVTD